MLESLDVKTMQMDGKTPNEKLMQRISLGSRHAFAVLISRYQRSFVHFTFRFLDTHADAE